MMRELNYAQALNEAVALCMAEDPNVFIMGLGVPDPKGVFGSTVGLQEKFGSRRVFDIPCAENGITGIAVGAALTGKRPIITHQRVDFAVLSFEQIINQAAKWHYMFGGQASVPLVIRMIIGRGWGQGPQHSQSLQSWFGHIPGLKVVMPTTAFDAKGLLIASIRDHNPVVFLEHRWLYNLRSNVPEGIYEVPLGKARVISDGSDVSIVSTSYMTIEALKILDELSSEGISAELIDVRSIKPIDYDAILGSVEKTGRLLALDTGWTTCGFASEIVARASEAKFAFLKAPPKRLALPDVPTPTSHALSQYFYPTGHDIANACRELMGRPVRVKTSQLDSKTLDVPNQFFTGPF